MMDALSGMGLIISALIAIWGIYQTYVTKGLEQKVHRLSVELDQSIQLLYRIRDLTTKFHKVFLFLIASRDRELPQDVMPEKYAEWSSLLSEARGISLAIGDKELIDLFTEPHEFQGKKMEERIMYLDELSLRARSEKIHARVTKLIQLTINDKL